LYQNPQPTYIKKPSTNITNCHQKQLPPPTFCCSHITPKQQCQEPTQQPTTTTSNNNDWNNNNHLRHNNNRCHLNEFTFATTTITSATTKSTFIAATPLIHIDKPPDKRVVELDEKVLIKPNCWRPTDTSSHHKKCGLHHHLTPPSPPPHRFGSDGNNHRIKTPDNLCFSNNRKLSTLKEENHKTRNTTQSTSSSSSSSPHPRTHLQIKLHTYNFFLFKCDFTWKYFE